MTIEIIYTEEAQEGYPEVYTKITYNSGITWRDLLMQFSNQLGAFGYVLSDKDHEQLWEFHNEL